MNYCSLTVYALFVGLLGLASSGCKEESVNTPPNINSLRAEVVSFSPFTVDFSVDVVDQEFDPLTITWDFGDGTTTEGGKDITHEYETGEVYQARVSISDGANEPVTASEQVDARIEQATVSVNPSTQFQVMQGFGGFGSIRPWWQDGPFYNDAFLDLLLNDLGVTILRDNVPIGFEPSNENDDPNDLDLSKFNISEDIPGVDSHLGQHLPYLKAMHEAGLEKMIATVWSPPIWMKHNDHRGNGTNDQTSAPPYTTTPDETTNQLRLDAYEEFAEYCVAYVRMLKRETGIDLYAFSVQNEPRFSQFYASCVHSPESLRDLVKVVGARFEQEGITTKLFVPEDVQSIFHIRQYLDAILNDPEANQYTDIFAIHNYRDNGVDPSDEGPQNWTETFQKAQQGGKEVWMTETSGFSPEPMSEAIGLAISMFNALHYGHASAWVYWQMSGGGDRPLIRNGTGKTYLYHISKHFYRHVRPGAVRVAINEGEQDLLALAFSHPDTGKKVVVLINIGSTPLEVSMEGSWAGETFETLTTAQRIEYVSSGTAPGAEAVIVPANGIVTRVTP